MRVLHVIDSLAGSGGAEHGMVREATRFSDGTVQRLVRLFERDELQPPLEDAGIEVRACELDSLGGMRLWIQGIQRIRREIRSFRPDVVHTSLFVGNVIGQTAARLEGVPVVSTFVLSGDPDLLERYQPGAASWKARVSRRMAGAAARWSSARFRALTNDALETNAALLGVDLDRGVVIPRGVLEPVTNPLCARDLGLPEDRPLVVNVGRLAAQKGQVHLVRAFVDVLAVAPDAVLVIIGRDGDAASDVRASVTKAGIGDSVVFTGYTPWVGHYLAHASVFAFPSLMEGLGTSVLEAMAAGLPVVAFDIPPVREVTDDGRAARLIPLGAEAGLAEGMVSGLRGELSGLAERGRRHYIDHYTIDAVSERVETLLVDCAASSS